MATDDAGDIEAAQANIVMTTAVVLNSISLAVTVPAVVIYVVFRRVCPAAVDRVSLRLAAAICFTDILYCVAQIISDVVSEDTGLCPFSVWGYIFFTLLYLYLTAAIAINLHVLFLVSDRRAKQQRLAERAASAGGTGRRTNLATRLEPYYYGCSIALALAVSVPGYVTGEYGWDETEQSCWFKNGGSSKSLIWQWLAVYAWVCIVVLYCAIVIGLVWRKLVMETRRLAQTMDYAMKRTNSLSSLTDPSAPGAPKPSMEIQRPAQDVHAHFWGRRLPMQPRQGSFSLLRDTADCEGGVDVDEIRRRGQRFQELRLVLIRILTYLIIPIFTQSGNIILTVQIQVIGSKQFGVLLMSYICTSIQGILNALAFIFIDPSMRKAYVAFKQEVVRWYFEHVELMKAMQEDTRPNMSVHVLPPSLSVLDRLKMCIIARLWVAPEARYPVFSEMQNQPREEPEVELNVLPNLHVAGARYEELENHRNSIANDQVDRAFLTQHERAMSLPDIDQIMLQQQMSHVQPPADASNSHRRVVSDDVSRTFQRFCGFEPVMPPILYSDWSGSKRPYTSTTRDQLATTFSSGTAIPLGEPGLDSANGTPTNALDPIASSVNASF